MKAIIQIILVAAIVALCYWIYQLIDTPLKFEQARADRETMVVERLKDIRTAQRSFRAKYGKFAGSFDELITYVQQDSMEVVMAIGDENDSTTLATRKRIVTYIPVRDTLFNNRGADFDVTKIRFVPFSKLATGEVKEFQMDTASLQTESKVVVPVFQAYAPYVIFLGDLDRQELINYRDLKVNTLGRADGLMVGSLASANNEAGNWE